MNFDPWLTVFSLLGPFGLSDKIRYNIISKILNLRFKNLTFVENKSGLARLLKTKKNYRCKKI